LYNITLLQTHSHNAANQKPCSFKKYRQHQPGGLVEYNCQETTGSWTEGHRTTEMAVILKQEGKTVRH